MVLLRSEADVDQWCRDNNEPRGEVVPLTRVWRLARAWYGDRMHPDFRGRSIEGAHAIFRQVGLNSDFWLG
jgi:hypothetical protein